MTDSTPHSRVWFSPHGTEWEAETYEEALEMERDSLVEQYEALREAAIKAAAQLPEDPMRALDTLAAVLSPASRRS